MMSKMALIKIAGGVMVPIYTDVIFSFMAKEIKGFIYQKQENNGVVNVCDKTGRVYEIRTENIWLDYSERALVEQAGAFLLALETLKPDFLEDERELLQKIIRHRMLLIYDEE